MGAAPLFAFAMSFGDDLMFQRKRNPTTRDHALGKSHPFDGMLYVSTAKRAIDMSQRYES